MTDSSPFRNSQRLITNMSKMSVFAFCMLLLIIVSLVGLTNLTNMAFDETCQAQYSLNYQRMTKASAIILWLTLGLSLISAFLHIVKFK